MSKSVMAHAKRSPKATRLEIINALNIFLLASQASLSRLLTHLNSSNNRWFQRSSCLAMFKLTVVMPTPSSTTLPTMPSSSKRDACITKCSLRSSTTTTSLTRKSKMNRTRTSRTPCLSRKGMWPRQFQPATRAIARCKDSKSLEAVFCLPRVRVLKYKTSHRMRKTLKKLLTREPSLSF